MEHRGRSRQSDVTLVLPPTLRDRLDEYARELAARSPGIKVSRSAAARHILLAALADDGKAPGR